MITVQIASVPEREEMLEKTVESLRPQVDKIWVGLNKYQHKPKFLKDNECAILDNSTGDAVKFYNAENLKGWVLTCDDDLIYPKGYVQYMTERAKVYKGIVTLHGKIHRPPIRFSPANEAYRCLGEVKKDVRVDVGGTGVMCYHTSVMKVAYSAFKMANMADLWMAKQAKEQGVKIYVLKHPENYLTYQAPEETIWGTYLPTGFTLQTKVLKSFM